MKATLKFNLDNPDDAINHLRAVKSLDLAIAIDNILSIRKKLERRFENTDNINNDVFDGIDAYADEVSKILDDCGINIDELLRNI